MSAPTTGILLNQTTPAAPSGDQNSTFVSDGATPLQSITVYPKRMVGDSGSGGKAGTVPPPAAGDGAANKWLKATGVWLAIAAADLVGAIFGASGGSHSVGAVPDPGSSAGTTRFLREDATWAAPGGSGGYFGDASATATGGESIVTLGSTPSDPNTAKMFLNGVLLDSNQYTISTNVLTMTANRFGVGDRVRVTWATANSTPGGVTLTSSSTPVTSFGIYTDSGGGGTIVVPFPATAAAGDFAILFLGYTNFSGPATPSGWTLVDNTNSSGFFWSGQIYSKTLTSADIATGSVTFATAAIYAAAVATFSGSPSILTSISSRGGTTPITLTTSSVPSGAIALYFGSQGATSPNGSTGAATWNRGALKATGNNTATDSASIYSETLGSTGTVTGIVSYASPTASHNYQAIVVLSVPSVTEGSFPEIRQSQISGFPPATDTGTANAYAVATSPTFGLVKGAFISFIAAHPNTGASTLAINGGSAIAITKNGNSTALGAGDITAGQVIDATYDGTVWQIAVIGPFASLTTAGTSGAATLSGGVLNVPNYSGGAGGNIYGNFDGSTNYIDVGTTLFNTLTAGSVSMWVYPAIAGAGNGGAIYQNTTLIANDNVYLALQQLANNKLRYYYFDAGSVARSFDSATALTVGAWNHVVVTWDGTGANIYINGALDQTSALTWANTNSAHVGQGNYVGRYAVVSGYNPYFRGCLSRVQVYNVLLTGGQVTTLYGGGTPTTQGSVTSGLTGAWALTEGSGGTAADSSGSGRTGTWAGTPLANLYYIRF